MYGPFQVLNFVLQMLLITLRDPDNGVDSRFFTREVLEGKDKKIGWVMMTMAKFPLVRQLLSLAANVPSSPGTSMQDAKEKIADVMSTPVRFSKTFHAHTTDEVNCEGEDDKPVDEFTAWGSSGTDITQLTESMPKCLSAFAELLYDVYVGVRLRRHMSTDIMHRKRGR